MDRGRHSPPSTRVTVADPQFWMQGRHTIDVRARTVGGPRDHRSDAGAARGPRRHRGADRRLRRRRQRDPRRRRRRGLAARGAAVPLRRRRRRRSAPGSSAITQRSPPSSTAPASRSQVRDEAGNVGALDFHGRTTAPSTSRLRLRTSARGRQGAARRCRCSSSSASRSCCRAVATSGCAASPSSAAPPAWPRRCWPPVAARTASARATTPTPIDEIGRYHDVVFKDGTLYVSAYDDTMGDLVYAEIKDPTLIPSWQVIDGVDLTATPDIKDGYRFGISDPGPDVGRWTSIALSSGKPMIAYFDVIERRAQVRARAAAVRRHHRRPGRHRRRRRRHVRRASPSTTSGVPTIAYVASGMSAGDHYTSELRVAIAANDHPAASDWSISMVDSTTISCAGRCGGGSACVVPAMVNGMPNGDPSKSTCVAVDAAPCAATCSATQACIAKTLHQRPAGDQGARSLRGHRAVRAGAPQRGRASWCSSTTIASRATSRWRSARLARGRSRSSTATTPTTDVGQFASAQLGGDDSVHVAYVDAICRSPALQARGRRRGADDRRRRRRRSARRRAALGRRPAPTWRSTPAAARASSTRTSTRSDLEVATNAGAWAHMDLRNRHRRLRLLPAPALRRRQALHDRVRLRSQNPAGRSARQPSRSASARPDPVEQQRLQVRLPRRRFAACFGSRKSACEWRAAVRKQMIEVSDITVSAGSSGLSSPAAMPCSTMRARVHVDLLEQLGPLLATAP